MPAVARFPKREEVEANTLKIMGDRYRWTADKCVEGVCLKGKTVLVTGGTSGIGIPTVIAMARTGARVITTARNEAKGAATAEKVKEETGKTIEIWALDLAVLKSVDDFVKKVKAEGVVFDFVLNNAGVMALPEFKKTVDGFEMQLQVNYIAPCILIKGLLDNKSISDTARIVVVSSCAVKMLAAGPLEYSPEKINWDNEAAYHKWAAYAYAKGMVVLHCNLLAKTLKDAGSKITVNSVHPGGICTGLQDGLSMEEMQEMGWFDLEKTVNPVFKSAEEGAATTVWVAVSEEMAGKTGNYCENCVITAKDDFGSDEDPVRQARGCAAYLWVEENQTKLCAVAEEKVGRKFI